MSPVAIGLALALHGLVIAAVWLMSPLRPTEPPEDAIIVTVDSGAPPTSPDSPSGEQPDDPTPAKTPEPTPAERPREEAQQALAEPQPPKPEPQQLEPRPPEPPQPTPPQPEAAAQQPPPPAPKIEEALAPQEVLPPPNVRDVPTKHLPLPPWPDPQPPQARPPPPQPRPSQQAPAPAPRNAPASVQAPTSNSADWLVGKSRARNAYLDQVARLTSKFRRYPASAFDNKQAGRVVTRVTIARDGRLIDVQIDTSSGWPVIDAAEIETIRKSAPFPPVPSDMPGDPLILILPIHYDLPIAARNR